MAERGGYAGGFGLPLLRFARVLSLAYRADNVAPPDVSTHIALEVRFDEERGAT